MIICKISGGLGNQLFQYALGRVISIRSKQPLKLDISAFEHLSRNKYSVRHFELRHFNISAEIATQEEVARYKYPFGVLSRISRGLQARIWRHRNIGFRPSILKRKDCYLEGYWQSEKYFIDYGDLIREDLTPRVPFGKQAQEIENRIIAAGCPVSLHIRRGDNAYNSDSMKKFGTPPTSYYLEGPKRVADMASDDIQVFVFSDDIAWARDNVKLEYETIYVSGDGIADWEEIMLMARCDHHVIANSTFSWWGAWLNPSPNKIVIAPHRWANFAEREFQDLIPDTWIRA